MSKLGIRWTICGIPAAYITRGTANGRYRVTFERDEAGLEAIESIDWANPEVVAVAEGAGTGLPAGYGFDLVDLTYQHSTRRFVAEIRTAKQYLGDISGYQAEIEALNGEIAAQQTAAEELKQQLNSAYEEGVESHG